MNTEQLRIEELKSKLVLAQDDLSIRTAELERVESERDALKVKLSEPTKTEVTAEEWLKATTLELCKVADHFIALRNDAERVDAAAVELMDSTAKLEQENTALQARVKRLEDELNDNGLVLQKLQVERDKAISMADRLEKAADAYVAVPCGCVCDGPCGHAEVYTNWIKAKETK